VSALSFSLKCKGLQDTTQHFIVKQMLKGMSKLYGTSGMRLFELVQANSPTLIKAEKARAKADMNMTASYRDEHTCINAVGHCFIIWTDIGSRMSDVPYNLSIPFNI
jgi:hypothetical protein